MSDEGYRKVCVAAPEVLLLACAQSAAKLLKHRFFTAPEADVPLSPKTVAKFQAMNAKRKLRY